MSTQLDFYKSIIYNALPNTSKIWTPDVCGAKNNVIFAQTPYNNCYAFKFHRKDNVIRNSVIAKSLRDSGIPVPEIVAQNYDDQWFEMYTIVRGKTLHQCVANRISHTELRHIYIELLKIFEKMSHIDCSHIDFGNTKYSYQTAYYDTTKTNGALLGIITSAAVRIMNVGKKSDIGLYHHGLTPKNIIISSSGKISGILDIDEVGICNKNYALGVMFAKAHLIGIPTKLLCDEYEHISNQQINRTQIVINTYIQNFGRNILFKSRRKEK